MSQSKVNRLRLEPIRSAFPWFAPSTDQSSSAASVEVSASKVTVPGLVTVLGVPLMAGASRRMTVGPSPPTGFETSEVCLTFSVLPCRVQLSVTATRL